MSRTVGFLVAGLLAGGVVLGLSHPALADAAGEYRTLFADKEKAAARKGVKAQVELATELMAAAKAAEDERDLQALLYEKAFEFAMKAPEGYPTALAAMKLLIKTAPDDKRAAARDKLLPTLQLRWAKSAAEERKLLGGELINLLVASGDYHAEAKRLARAIALYMEARTIATAEASPRAKEIVDRIQWLAAAQEGEKKTADLRTRLAKEPNNPAVRSALILACLVELDDPAEAAKLLTVDVDEVLRTYVPLAARKVEDLDPEACHQLAEWYASLSEKASAGGKYALAWRAKKCLDRYVAIHTKQDADLAEARKLLAEVDKVMAKAPGPLAGNLPLTLDLSNDVTMKLAFIPAGRFTMGSPRTESRRGKNESPQHEVVITRPFHMGIYEVTQDQYRAVMGKNPSQFLGKNCPVEWVTWENAMAFCTALSQKTGKTVRLPTEAEWEYACRAKSKTRFSFGDEDAKLGEYAWFDGNCEGRTHPVGQKKPNAFGLYDMHGNACEWCSDWLADSYDPPDGTVANTKLKDPPGAQMGIKRVLRGGNWGDLSPACRSAARSGGVPNQRNDGAGIRIVISADEPN